MNKKEIIEELKKQEIDFNSRMNKDELIDLLKNAEFNNQLKNVPTLIKAEQTEIDEPIIKAEQEVELEEWKASYKSKGRTFELDGVFPSIEDAKNALDKAGAIVRKISKIKK